MFTNSDAETLKETKTTCPYCGVGCGVIVKGSQEEGWSVKGDTEHPANLGRLCSKGSALGQTLSFEDRLLYPYVNGARVSWDSALDTVADGFKRILETHGPDSVAFYLSGQLLTEDYYIANKLSKGFLGSSHVDTNSRLCMASSVAGHKRAFGADTVPNCYDDLEQADLLVLVGSNAAWCHPVLFQRMQKNRKERGAKLVNVDIRETATSGEADISLIIKPGTDVYLFNGLFVYLVSKNIIDSGYITEHCEGYADALSAATESSPNIEVVANACGLDIEVLTEFYELFAKTHKTVTCYSQGVNQSSSGTDKVNSILNCHLITGRIGKSGCGPLSLTGQPNAMGGREVGGLANTLAAHMGFDETSVNRVRTFWDAPNMANQEGLKAVDMFDAIHDGKIKALWVQCTNPAVSIPNSNKVREALSKAELVIVSECVSKTDTMDFAHVKLPAATWGEKSGTVTNSERRISRQRSFLKPPGEAKPDWWMVMEVAKRMGFAEAFDYNDVSDIFKEHAELSTYQNNNTRDFDITGLNTLTEEEYDNLNPVQWPVKKDSSNGQERFFANGGFFTPSKKGQIISVKPKPIQSSLSEKYPLWLNTGRIRDQWHTMTRTARCSVLNRHRPEPFIEISEEDAKVNSIEDGYIVRVKSECGECLLRARITDDLKKGYVFSPIHWTKVNSSSGVISNLVIPNTDAISGQPESKAVPVSIEKVDITYSVLILSKDGLPTEQMTYWTQFASDECKVQIGAINKLPEKGWLDWASKSIGVDIDQLTSFEDSKRDIFRAAYSDETGLQSVIIVSPGPIISDSQIAEAWFQSEELWQNSRGKLLSMRRMDGLPDRGPTVCACFSVGLNEIISVIESGKAITTDDIGNLLKAGTNCGSCVPEMRAILTEIQQPKAAE